MPFIYYIHMNNKIETGEQNYYEVFVTCTIC